MNKQSNFKFFWSVTLVILFGSFLLSGTLLSSDFQRGIFSCPYDTSSVYWQDFESLNGNVVWNTRGAWESFETVEDYFERLGTYHQKAILDKGIWWPGATSIDSIPYWVNFYGHGQQNSLQLEWSDSAQAVQLLGPNKGESYYYFDHESGTTVLYEGDVPNNPGVAALECKKDSSSNDIFAKGCDLTDYDFWFYEPKLDFNGNKFGYRDTGRLIVNRVRVAINDTIGLSDSTVVMRYNMLVKDTLGGSTNHYLDFYRVDFSGNFQFITKSIEDSIFGDYELTRYEFTTTNECDLYVDYIEYMDKEQAYPIFSGDQTLRDTVFARIKDECEGLDSLAELYNTDIVGFDMSDGPQPSIVNAIGEINENVFSGIGNPLSSCPPRTRFLAKYPDHRFERFFEKGKPIIFDAHFYPFSYYNSLGDQNELSRLSDVIENSYSHAKLADVDLVWKAQAADYDITVATASDSALRNPDRSEIFAQGYLAIAHGAKGLIYYKYQTNDSYTSRGLVLPESENYAHPDSGGYSKKFEAVKEVFTQLDSIGDDLLDMTRVRAFCAADSDISLMTPLTDIYYTEDTDDDTIEVGKFYDTSSDTFLVIVNRHTDADRHITIETDLTGSNALLDLYTQERFVSSTGNFKSIPFDSGEGRVFKVEEGFND